MELRGLLKLGIATMKYLFYALFVCAILISCAYMTNVVIAILNEEGSLYGGISIILFILSCIVIFISVFLGIKAKIYSSILFFSFLMITSYNDLVANAIFHSDNEGRELFINMAFFILGYILPAVGIVVGVRLLILPQHGKAVRTSGQKGDSR